MDLIGYDHFEVVGEMLENRQALVASVLENPVFLAHDGVCVRACVYEHVVHMIVWYLCIYHYYIPHVYTTVHVCMCVCT